MNLLGITVIRFNTLMTSCYMLKIRIWAFVLENLRRTSGFFLIGCWVLDFLFLSRSANPWVLVGGDLCPSLSKLVLTIIVLNDN